MGLDETESIGKRDVANTPGAKGAGDLDEMLPLVVSRTDVLDDVIRDDRVERRVLERQRRGIDAMVRVGITNNSNVDDIDRVDAALRTGGCRQGIGDDTGAGADVEDTRARQRRSACEQGDDLPGLDAPPFDIEVRVRTRLLSGRIARRLGAHRERDTNIARVAHRQRITT